MNPKRVINYLAIAICCLITAGCIQPSVKMQVEGLSAKQISTIKSADNKVSIVGVDGEKSVGFMEFILHDGQWAGEASLRPGKHRLNILYDDGHIKSQYLYALNTQAGSTYTINYQIVNRSAFLWFEDSATGKTVGKVVASMNEPLTDKNRVLDHSVYFTLNAPREDGWLVTYRNGNQTALAKEGDSIDETYAMGVVLFELPNLNTKQEFFNHMEESLKKGENSKRFNLITKDLKYFDGKADFCVRQHRVAEDKEAVKRSGNKGAMILEMADFFCRLPRNKNIGIAFDYSHRYYAGHQDKNLAKSARASFSLLKF